MNKETKIFIAVLFIIWIGLGVRIYSIAIQSRDFYTTLAYTNTFKERVIVPSRGRIFDRNNKPLAVSDTGFLFAIAPHLNLNKPEIQQKIALLISFLPLNMEQIQKIYQSRNSAYNHDFIPIDFVSYDMAHQLFPYVAQYQDIFELIPIGRRRYPNKTTASHLIGYIGKANTKDIQDNPISKYTGVIGKEGLERYYNDFLQGELGKQRVKVTALNEEVEVLEETQIEYNNNLYLSIDLDLQKSMDTAFAGQNGAAVVLAIHNGEILAAGSYPEYDINEFPTGISTEKWEALLNNPYKPLYNKLIYGAYPPGSVIKMGVGLSFLQHGIIDENTIIPTPEFIEIGNRKFRDWRKGGHGSANFMYSIKRSVDVYYYKLSLQAGIEKIAKTLSGFGIGQKTGIDLPAEMAGILPTPEWKRRRHKQSWQMGDTLNTSIGQGYMLTTPMQIARYTAALASGKLVTPHLVMRKGNETLEFDATETLDIQQNKLNAARLGMFQVCNEAGGTGFARALKSKVTLACKTGTAQVTGISQADKARIAEEDMDYFHRSHAWFTAFVPYEKPKYAITVLIEHGMHGASAGDTTVLLANTLFDLGYIEPQYRKK